MSSLASKSWRAFTLLALAASIGAAPFAAQAQPMRPDRGHEPSQSSEPPMMRQPAPRGYRRFEPPRSIAHRPDTLDHRVFNRDYRAHRQYRIGRYWWPEGARYQHYRHGEFLPSAFWARDFWLTDFWLFGLEIPPAGYEWVRYGPDALLVNITTGQVVEVIYDMFL